MCASQKKKSHGHDGNVFLFMIDRSFFFCRAIWNLQFRCESATLVYLLVVDCSLLVVVKETVFLPDPIILFLK